MNQGGLLSTGAAAAWQQSPGILLARRQTCGHFAPQCSRSAPLTHCPFSRMPAAGAHAVARVAADRAHGRVRALTAAPRALNPALRGRHAARADLQPPQGGSGPGGGNGGRLVCRVFAPTGQAARRGRECMGGGAWLRVRWAGQWRRAWLLYKGPGPAIICRATHGSQQLSRARGLGKLSSTNCKCQAAQRIHQPVLCQPVLRHLTRPILPCRRTWAAGE